MVNDSAALGSVGSMNSTAAAAAGWSSGTSLHSEFKMESYAILSLLLIAIVFVCITSLSHFCSLISYVVSAHCQTNKKGNYYYNILLPHHYPFIVSILYPSPYFLLPYFIMTRFSTAAPPRKHPSSSSVGLYLYTQQSTVFSVYCTLLYITKCAILPY